MRFGLTLTATGLAAMLAGTATAGDYGCCRTSAVQVVQQASYYDAAPVQQVPVYAPVQQQFVQKQVVVRQQAVYAQPVQVVRQKQFVQQQQVYGYGGFQQGFAPRQVVVRQQFAGRQRFGGGGFARGPGGGGRFGALLSSGAQFAGGFFGAQAGGPVGAGIGAIAGRAVGQIFE
jgi:hypothetical protein